MTRRMLLLIPGGLAACAAAAPIPRFEVMGHIAGLAPNHHAVVRATGREPHTAATRADGTYILRGLRPGSYTIRPSHPLYRFVPAFRTVGVTTHDVADRNFVAHRKPRK